MGEPSGQAGAAEFVRLAWTYVSSSGGREGKDGACSQGMSRNSRCLSAVIGRPNGTNSVASIIAVQPSIHHTANPNL
jgi:hypothetical protein